MKGASEYMLGVCDSILDLRSCEVKLMDEAMEKRVDDSITSMAR